MEVKKAHTRSQNGSVTGNLELRMEFAKFVIETALGNHDFASAEEVRKDQTSSSNRSVTTSFSLEAV
jgi:hypothetical protein